MNHYRPYTGSMPYAAGLARSLADWLRQEIPGLERRLWTENDANAAVKDSATRIHADLARAEAYLREIEAKTTSVEEEQDAAKEVNTYAAA